MGKLFFGCAILASFLALSLLHCSYVEKSFSLLETQVAETQSLAENGQYEAAVAKVEESIENWRSMELYTQIFICNSDVDSTEETFYDFMGSIYSGDTGLSHGYCEKLLSLLKSIAGGEKPQLRNLL